MSSTVVLAIGHDPLLLHTRRHVLQSAGFTVMSVLSLKQAITQFLQGDFDLVILCHSIPAQDRERLAHLIREHSSRTPIIFVSPGFDEYDPCADATIKNAPEDLVAGLREVLDRIGKRFGAGNGHAA